jgi:hypothetical protein
MKRRPKKRNGDPVSETAASMVLKNPDDLARLSKWLRLAELLVCEARENPTALHQLEVWIARMRRALP